MDYVNDFDIFVGGKSGIFKGVKIDKKTCISKNIQNLVSITKDDEVTAMSWADEDEREILLGCGSTGVKSIKIYDSENSSFTTSFQCNDDNGKIRGISYYNNAVITAAESGHVKLWNCDYENDQLLIEAGENLHRMRHSNINKDIIATGGREHKLQLFDLEKKARIFEEKNVRHDWLELRVPVWVSDIGFLTNSSKIAACSRYGYVRLYDPTTQRRPVINLEIKDQALTTLAIAPRENHIVVGSGKGIMNLIDLRNGKILNTYKGFVGGITAIACCRDNPYIVSVGLDRYLRIHDLNTKELLQKSYLTSRLSCMVLRSNFTLNAEENSTNNKNKTENTINETNNQSIQILEDEFSNDEEYDAMFDKMPTILNEENEKNLTLQSLKKRKKYGISDKLKDKKKLKNQIKCKIINNVENN